MTLKRNPKFPPSSERVEDTDPAVDKLLPQQAAHDVGAEVHDVLDLPEGLLHRLQGKERTASELRPIVTLNAQ